MILYGYDKDQECAVILVDIFDVKKLLEGEVDPPTKKLLSEIQKKLEEYVRDRVQIPVHKDKKRRTRKTKKKPDKKKKKRSKFLEDLNKKLQDLV